MSGGSEHGGWTGSEPELNATLQPLPVAQRAPRRGARFLLRCAPLTHSNTCYTWSVILGLGVSPMRRREFITLLGAAAAWPFAARAQQSAKVPAIGFLGSGTPITAGAWVVAFAQRLRELGWIEDRTIKIDLRWAEGRNDRSAEIVTDFVRLKVDVIVTYGSEHIQIAKEATSTIPIVALMGDPVGSGLVASLAHPGGNLTGLSGQNADLNGKRFELLHEIVPNLRRLAVLFNGNNLAYRLEADIVRAAALPLGLEVLAAEIRSGDDIAPTFAAIATNADALLVVGEPLDIHL